MPCERINYLTTLTGKSRPSHWPRSVQSIVKRTSTPAASACVGRSQRNVPKPVARLRLSVVVIQLSDDQRTETNSRNSRRRIRPAGIRLTFEALRQTTGAGWGLLFTYRAWACGGMSNTAPSRNERSNLICSACAQTNGIALPEGRPKSSSRSGISSLSQICSGRRPPGLAEASNVANNRRASSSRPAAIS